MYDNFEEQALYCTLWWTCKHYAHTARL